jgi:type IV secretory pathway VirB10-like protein
VVSEPDGTRSGQGAEPAAAFRLRGETPPVMRLSRKVLSGLVVVGATMIFGALLFAFYQSNRPGGGAELYSTENKPSPDRLSTLPRDYAGIPTAEAPRPPAPPQLGPPVPGDFGRPQPVPGAEGVDPEAQRIAQEDEAARTSRLFATTSARERPASSAPLPAAPVADARPAPGGQAEGGPLDPGSLLNMQDRKAAFVNGAVDRRTVSSDHLENPASRYVVQAGSVIPAALITGMRSDLPGQVTAQVTENVYDSPTGRYLLIPQGAKLIGVYDSQVAYGQDRLLLVWTRLILPNGRSIVLERQPGADPQGFVGLEDEVDQHWSRLAMSAVLSTVIGIGSELGSNANDSAIASALRQGSSNSLSQTGQQITQRNLNIQPTLTIRPGFPVRVILNRDLVLATYQG